MTPDDSNLRIRRMTRDDIEAVMAIAASLKDAPNWPLSSYAAILEPGRKPERVALVVADGANRIAGFLVAAMITPQSELESIAISSDFQRRGLARELIAALARELLPRNCTEIFLEVRSSNHTARAFYASLGFVEAGRRPSYYSNPGEDAIVMRLDLERPADQP